MKPVAVIILNWNGKKLLEKYLPSVVENTADLLADVIVADNGSTDDSVAWLMTHYPGVKLLRFTQNYGFAEGYNRAIAEFSQYRYTVLLNSDVRVPEGWLVPLYNFLQAHPEVAAVQPKIKSDANPLAFEYAGAAGGFLDCHGYPYCRGRLFSTVEEDNHQYDDDTKIFWASGAALMVRTAVYNAVGGLDAKFFAHMEEIDLCWRMLLAGHEIYAVGGSEVFHLGGGSLPASNPKKTFLNFRNNLLLMHKNLPDKDRGAMLFVRRLYDTLSFFMFVATFQWANARAVIKAHNDFRAMRGAYTVHPEVNLLKLRPGAQHNVVWKYFARGKKKFSDL